MIGSIVRIIITIIFLSAIIAANAVADDFPTLLKKLNNIQKQLDNINTTQSHDITKSQTQTPTPQPISNAPVVSNISNRQVSSDGNFRPSETFTASRDELMAELRELSYQLRSMVSQPEQQPEPAISQVDQETSDTNEFITELQELTSRLEAIIAESKNEK